MENQSCLINTFLEVYEGYGKSKITIDNYKICLNEMKKYVFDNKDFTVSDIKSKFAEDYIINWLEIKRKEGMKNSSLNQRISALRSFYKWLIGRQQILIDVSKSIPSYDVNKTSEVKEPLTLEESIKLVNYVRNEYKEKPSYKTCKNLLLIEIFLAGGLRIKEVSNLKFNNFDLDNNRLDLTCTKFDKDRAVSIPAGLTETLILYKDYREQLNVDLSEDNKDYIFISQKLNKLSTDQIRRDIYKLYKKLDIPNRDIHSLRKAYTTIMISSGAEIHHVSKQLGHEKIDTTLNIYNKPTLENIGEINPLFEHKKENKVVEKNKNVIHLNFA